MEVMGVRLQAGGRYIEVYVWRHHVYTVHVVL